MRIVVLVGGSDDGTAGSFDVAGELLVVVSGELLRSFAESELARLAACSGGLGVWGQLPAEYVFVIEVGPYDRVHHSHE